jgi:hypothetical protein
VLVRGLHVRRRRGDAVEGPVGEQVAARDGEIDYGQAPAANAAGGFFRRAKVLLDPLGVHRHAIGSAWMRQFHGAIVG